MLRLSQLAESDMLVDLFTSEKGRITALAKGGKRSRKRFFGLLLTGHLLEIELLPSKKGGSLWLLAGARIMQNHLGLREDFRRFMASGPVLEILLRGTPAMDPMPQVLELAKATLARLSLAKGKAQTGSALVVFLTRLLALLGYRLHLSSCLVCGRPIKHNRECRLSLAGGHVCPHCRDNRFGVIVPAGLAKGLETAANLEVNALNRLSFSKAHLNPAMTFLTRFWQETLGHDLPSLGLALRLLTRETWD
ncbi:DNA repair protein RecO [Dethiosulfatarculus sandiegensis]|uniref:DNA repair protein RecO n=1 Tax=Dethiosulfatarculus sandiegensis TaxID=1429043 RepID=UPI0018D01548|nr:DNA repair protein RecO [Dethiosulfatarculus sandiegensis]